MTKPIRSLTIVRTFDAPRMLVWQAWTDPKQMIQWWGPKGSDNPACELDVRPGGKIVIHMRGPGFDHVVGGEFREVDPPRHLSFIAVGFYDEDGKPKLENMNWVDFDEVGGKTRMTLRCDVLRASPDLLPAIEGMDIGWNESFDRLVDLLARMPAGARS